MASCNCRIVYAIAIVLLLFGMGFLMLRRNCIRKVIQRIQGENAMVMSWYCYISEPRLAILKPKFLQKPIMCKTKKRLSNSTL